MIDFIHTLLTQSGFAFFLSGMGLITLASLLRATPVITREKLSLQCLMPGLFMLGFSRVLFAYSDISLSRSLVFASDIFKIAALHFFLEFIRRNLHRICDTRITAAIHAPALLLFIASHFLTESATAINGLISLFSFSLCIMGLIATKQLPTPNINYTRACLIAGLIAAILNTLPLFFAQSMDFPVENLQARIFLFEIILVFAICLIILLGKYRSERRSVDHLNAHSLTSPLLFLLAIVVISIFATRIFAYMHQHNRQQIEINLDNATESLTQLINQRIHFASTSSRIMADSPIMAQVIDNPDETNKALLEFFLDSFAKNNADGICYLMNTEGLVLAASSKKELFVGNNLSQRQYFQTALNGHSGSLIDIGLFTNQLGYYSSNPVKRLSDGKIIGVCAVKRNLEDLENYLKLYHPAMLVDPTGNIFLASDRNFSGKRLIMQSAGKSTSTVQQTDDPQIFSFEKSAFAHVTRPIDLPGWHILILANLREMKNNKIWLFTTIILITFILITLLHSTILAGESRSGFEMAREQFHVVFYHAPESILIISRASLKILAANNSMLRQFRLTADAAGKSYTELLPRQNRSIRNARHNSREKIFKHERDFALPEGNIFSAEVTGSQINFAGESAILLLLHDISAHKQIELELLAAKNSTEEASQLKTRFFANASHEIRTPITAIIGLTELARSFCNSDEQRRILDLIKTSEKSLLTLLNDILDLSRIEAGKFAIKPVPFNLKTLLNNVIGLIRFKIGEKKLTVHLDFELVCPDSIISDPDRIRQVLLNLLDNAVKFTEKGRIDIKVSITNKDSGPVLELQVADTGCGIPEDIQGELFLPFIHADTLQRNSERGAGLGLAISKQIVETMNGNISYSTSPGKGTVFLVTLPIERATAKDLKAIGEIGVPIPVKLAIKDRPLKFLVADDNDINLFLASSIIEKFGGLSCCAKDGIETINLLQRDSFDAILIDIQMPRLDGIEAIKQIRSMPAQGGMPIIAVSAFASNLEKEKAITAGANFYLSKPYFPDDLLMAIKSVMDIEENPNQADSTTCQADENPVAPAISLRQIDLKELEIRILKKPENIAQISEIFTRRSTTLLADLDSCIALEDVQKLRETCHSIKGLTGMLAAAKAYTHAREMEELCRDNKFEQASLMVAALKVFISEIAEDLSDLTRSAFKKMV